MVKYQPMEKIKEHKIKSVLSGSIAEELGIEAGDVLLSINGEVIEDIFDYQFMIQDEYIEVLIRKEDGEEWELEIDKESDEDLGVEFETGLMDEYRSCHNKCIFCFIDQMPKGMRDTLYFKDDDSRLSFLQGNYVTLTNMSQKDIDRIVKYRLEPINISFQTTNPELRVKMLHNRFAGEALKKADYLYEHSIKMNGQIVLCRGINDGAELDRTITDLMKYIPHLQSVSIVPVGLSKHRDGLFPLKPFNSEDANYIIDQVKKYRDVIYKEHGYHFIHLSDEWFLLAGREIPKSEEYDGYPQYENGVGMLRLLMDEFDEAIDGETGDNRELHVSFATGKLAFDTINGFAKRVMEKFPNVKIDVYPIRNDFFGEMITVSGLLTATDIINQLKGKDLGKTLYLPQNLLRSGEEVLLDDLTITDISQTLQVPVDIVKSSGIEIFRKMVVE